MKLRTDNRYAGQMVTNGHFTLWRAVTPSEQILQFLLASGPAFRAEWRQPILLGSPTASRSSGPAKRQKGMVLPFGLSVG